MQKSNKKKEKKRKEKKKKRNKYMLIQLREFVLTMFSCKVDLRHIDEIEGSNIVEIGMDLSEFYMSVEWDILEVPAVR